MAGRNPFEGTPGVVVAARGQGLPRLAQRRVGRVRRLDGGGTPRLDAVDPLGQPIAGGNGVAGDEQQHAGRGDEQAVGDPRQPRRGGRGCGVGWCGDGRGQPGRERAADDEERVTLRLRRRPACTAAAAVAASARRCRSATAPRARSM
jgi:hypothetical protein